MYKVCFKCKDELELPAFFKLKSSSDGRDYTCKECSAIVSKMSETEQYDYRQSYHRRNNGNTRSYNKYKLTEGYKYRLLHEM